MRPVIGIDPSLRGCATCVIKDGEPLIIEVKTNPKNYDDCYRGRKKRINALLDPIEKLCREYAPGLIAIEGYSYGTRVISYPALELASILRYQLEGYADDFVEVTPAHLKQFATGKGNANKASVVSALTKRYSMDFDSDNKADAFALAKLAEVVSGYGEPETQIQAKVAQSIRDQIAKDKA